MRHLVCLLVLLLPCVCNANCATGSHKENSACMSCGKNYYCTGDDEQQPCPAGSTAPSGAKLKTDCACLQNYYIDADNPEHACLKCGREWHCPGAGADPTPCAANRVSILGDFPYGIMSGPGYDGCVCTSGWYDNGEDVPCNYCEPGFVCILGRKVSCPLNSAAPEGSGNPMDCECSPGFHRNTTDYSCTDDISIVTFHVVVDIAPANFTTEHQVAFTNGIAYALSVKNSAVSITDFSGKDATHRRLLAAMSTEVETSVTVARGAVEATVERVTEAHIATGMATAETGFNVTSVSHVEQDPPVHTPETSESTTTGDLTVLWVILGSVLGVILIASACTVMVCCGLFACCAQAVAGSQGRVTVIQVPGGYESVPRGLPEAGPGGNVQNGAPPPAPAYAFDAGQNGYAPPQSFQGPTYNTPTAPPYEFDADQTHMVDGRQYYEA